MNLKDFNSYEYGRYQLYSEIGSFRQWITYYYRVKNGIMEATEAKRKNPSWRVIQGIPAGAILF